MYFDVLKVDCAAQTLAACNDGIEIKKYVVSTARNGLGELENSYKTPRGWHQVIDKIGVSVPIYGVFDARNWTGEIWDEQLACLYPKKDWILTRILRLSGLEPGKNQGVNAEGLCVDSYQRYIYIHGTADESGLGTANSHGCIRMNNQDMLELFIRVDCQTKVVIESSE